MLKHSKYVNTILKLNKKGLSCSEIASKVKHSYLGVYKRLKYYNVKINPERKQKFNIDFFENIDSEIKAYWLGFIFADGCVLRRKYKYQTITALRLVLAEKDIDHLKLFRKSISSKNSICVYSNKLDNTTKCSISLNSEKLVSDLEKTGCVQRKSLVLKYPKLLENLDRHFIRGYFDGDGCISFYSKPNNKTCRVSFIGTCDFLLKLREILVNNGVWFTLPRKSGNYFVLEGGGNNKCRQFYKYLYCNANYFLNRKENKFHAIL
jgi:hypothetical protein